MLRRRRTHRVVECESHVMCQRGGVSNIRRVAVCPRSNLLFQGTGNCERSVEAEVAARLTTPPGLGQSVGKMERNVELGNRQDHVGSCSELHSPRADRGKNANFQPICHGCGGGGTILGLE
ncbi:hypothetical protein DPEC_G00019080 [Dallia pectoralis]|uniref:Uncharacterized protein n=1 Tax=Dallia pectoralis TaxID=75939 RepID=A0ACC2HFT5_DALPE|nr:hypothetical protein DPEC_G00019080 [Dallia pectoralis]